MLLKSLDSLERKPAKSIDTEIYLWTIKSAIEYKLGELRESEASSINVLKMMDSSEESGWMNFARIRTYNILGILKKELVEYEKSLKYYRKVLTLTDDPAYLAGVYGNIGLVYTKLEEYNLAISHYEKALNLSENLDKPELTARFLDDLGHAESMLDLSNAESTLLNSLKIRDSLDLKEGEIYSHLHLSEHYFRNEDKSKALFHSENALQIAQESKLIPLELSALENLLKLEDERATQRFAFLSDSLKRVEQSSSNKFAEIRYGVALKEREAEQLRTKNRYYFLIFSTIIIVVVFTSILIYNRSRQRNKIAVMNESINTEKRISARMHDEIANDLYHTMLGLQKVVPENESLLNNLDHIYNRVRDISRDNSPLDPDSNFSKDLEDLFIAYKNSEVNILTLNLGKMDWSKLKAHEKTNLYRVLQELLTNMKKHSGATHVVFMFSQNDDTIKISYQDNGMGSDILKGNGLLNIKNRIKSIDGSVTFESEKGHGFKAAIIL
ncbi:tetratricopeptide repeat-containing sensor histidine kinase [Nonlabens spongiae]|uniref:tetratricopeptide repeat-containing sensor histidine kinase n=1 Tax=Nonlabens spongiae TaxID=331648 RepID=UPI00146F3068|nr:tetratricopeptide repeat-containing sensor histidine kinase [Nonlabens spongiae]